MIRRRLLMTSLAACAAPSMLTAASALPVKLRDLYNRDGTMSDLALANAGDRMLVEGYMAPPLRAQSDFFVLTKMPMAVCPFCETAAEWPEDILAVYTKRVVAVMPFNVKIDVRGVLEMGEFRDPDTGFVSLARLTDATYG